jgi:hypothetical protein
VNGWQMIHASLLHLKIAELQLEDIASGYLNGGFNGKIIYK